MATRLAAAQEAVVARQIIEKSSLGRRPGSAGVPPAQHRQGFTQLLDPGRPATSPGLCFDRAHAVPTGRVAGCRIAGKLSGTQRGCMRAGRPRSRVGILPSLLLLKGSTLRLAGSHPVPFRQNRHAWWPLVVLRGPSWITLFLLSQAGRGCKGGRRWTGSAGAGRDRASLPWAWRRISSAYSALRPWVRCGPG